MGDKEQLLTAETAGAEQVYFDLLAEMDFTKHLGGIDATLALIELCHIGEDKYVLDVGCGVGVTPCYLAQRYDCRVVGVDLYEKMIERAKERARKAGVADRVEFRVADAQSLPFEDALFDAVIGESVVAFVADKESALREWVRVTKPGGYVGFTEATWVKTPTPELLAYMAQAFGPNMKLLPPDGWQQLLAGAGLKDIVASAHRIAMRQEASSQLKRAGLGYIAKTWGRALSLLIKRPVYRNILKGALSEPKELVDRWGYGVWVGRK